MNRAVVGLAFVLGACGGGSAPGSVVGDVRGTQLEIADAISRSGGDNGVEIIMTTTSDACSDLAGNINHTNENVVLISLTDSAHPLLTTGTYTIVDPGSSGTPPAQSALFEINLSDGTCLNNADNDPTASSGTVTLTSVGTFSGTFDVVLDSGEVTGAFDASVCTAMKGTGATVCD